MANQPQDHRTDGRMINGEAELVRRVGIVGWLSTESSLTG